MWNHAQTCPSTGEDENNESNPTSGLKDRIEKSLDLTQYLKYLDNLFSQSTSESDSSDNEDGERTFTDFVQPSAQPLSLPPPPYTQNSSNLAIGSSNSSDSSSLANLTGLKSNDNFHLESNISSPSLSSIDSGTSSLSLNLSTEAFVETTLAKAEEAASAVPLLENNSGEGRSPSLCTESSSSSVAGAEDDKLGDEDGSSSDKKKSQKKKKTSKGDSESSPRQNKPNSGGKGNNNGSQGGNNGGAGGPSSSGSDGANGSNDNAGGSTGSSQNVNSGSGGSPGSSSRSGEQSLHASVLNQDVILHQSLADSQLDVTDDTDSLLLNDDLADSFPHSLLGSTNDEGIDLESHDLNSFPISALLDIQENETSLSDYISMTNPVSVPITSSSVYTSSMSQSSTNFFSKIAANAAASAFSNSRNSNNSSVSGVGGSQSQIDGYKHEGKKRKLEEPLGSGKLLKLSEKQKEHRVKVLNSKRRKIYVSISRKEIGKTQRNRVSTFKEALAMKKKLAQACAKYVRKKALQSDKCMKESVCKAKRLTQEMEAYWKNKERAERDSLRKMEREAELKHRHELELLNSRLYHRKLNRLVTQAELFSFKLLKSWTTTSHSGDGIVQDLLKSLDEVVDQRISHLDKYDSEIAKGAVQASTDRALKDHQNLVTLLDKSGLYLPDDPSMSSNGFFKEVSQPQMFEGVLNKSQLYGMGWLYKTYRQGLNGILEGGNSLCSYLEVIAFISHLAETCGVWGPYLIVASSANLYKWQQNFEKMSPRLKIVSYFGKPMERKNMRHQWEKADNVHSENTNFHLVLTSHEVMASDLKYISTVKWQYLVMEDFRGVLTSSTKWMSLLSFRCRTKLLLSSTLQLNSLSHLIAYLYFVMPSLFDSDEEFSEWLLRELESIPAGSKRSPYDEGLVRRLRQVLVEYLLDQNKRERENSKIPSIDVQLFCAPTTRQRHLYSELLQKSNLEQIGSNLETYRLDEVRNRIRSVLNLSGQLKKICNHPGLVEERAVQSPFYMKSIAATVPTLAFEDKASSMFLNRLFCIYSAVNIYHSLFSEEKDPDDRSKVTNICKLSTWSFVRMMHLSPREVEDQFSSTCARLTHLVNFQSVLDRIYYERILDGDLGEHKNLVYYPEQLLYHNLSQNQVLRNLVLASTASHNFYSWGTCEVTPDVIENRSLSSKQSFRGIWGTSLGINSASHTVRPHPLLYPKFLECFTEKVLSEGFKPKFCSWSNSQLATRFQFPEARFLISEISNSLNSHQLTVDEKVALSVLQTSFVEYCGKQAKFPDIEFIVSDSGKLKRLDELLQTLKRNRAKVLLCSYENATIDLLKEFLEFKRFRYTLVNNSDAGQSGSQEDAFVCLFQVRHCLRNPPRLSIDTVVFFDQDWIGNYEEQKKVVAIKLKLENPSRINYYRLICKGTIEERLLEINQDKNIASLLLCKDNLESMNGSSVPSLRSLVSVLLCDGSRKQVVREASSNFEREKSTVTEPITKSFNTTWQTPNKYTKDKIYAGAANDKDWNWERNLGDEQTSLVEMLEESRGEGALETTKHQEDQYVYMDEGYSPETLSIKPDYEEDSSPKANKLVRGSGKRGRPPSRRYCLTTRELNDDNSPMKRGPGRPRLKCIGPLNQGIRGRRPGRPPLTKKAETISSGLAPINSNQRVFGFYSSPDLEFS